MQKKKEVTARTIYVNVFLTTLFSVILSMGLYSVIAPLAMDLDKAKFRAFTLERIPSMVLFGGLAAVVVMLVFRPIANIIKLYEQGKTVPEDDLYRAKKLFKVIPTFLIVLCFGAYVIGTFFNYLPAIIHHQHVVLDECAARCTLVVLWGTVSGVFCGRIVNMSMIAAKARLHIYDMKWMKDEKIPTLRSVLIMPISLLFFFYLVFFCITAYFTICHFDQESARAAASSLAGGAGPLTEAGFLNLSYAALKLCLAKIFAVSVGVFVVLFALMMVGIADVTIHIRNLSEQVSDLSQGEMDLTKRINIVSFDDIGIMTADFNAIIASLQSTFAGVRKLILNVYGTSSQMNENVAQSREQSEKVAGLIFKAEESINEQVGVINRTSQLIEKMVPVIESSIGKINSQTEAVDTTSRSLSEIISAMKEIDESAVREETVYKQILTMVESGSAMIENSIQAMEAIEQTSHKITDIAGIISGIAESTNILAMNAAIEASHAGEYGKGFAIVSSEIRSLAEGTSKSTDDISGLIKEMTQKISNGVNAFAELKNILDKIIQGVRDTGSYITGITSQAQEQSAKAADRLEDIGSLVKMTGELKSEAQAQKEVNIQIDSAIVELNDAAKNVIDVNHTLTESMSAISSAFENIRISAENTFGDIKLLENQISSFRIGGSEGGDAPTRA